MHPPTASSAPVSRTGTWETLFEKNAPAPGGSIQFDEVVHVNLNDAGRVAFINADQKGGNFETSLWIEEQNGFKLLAINGDRPPGEQFFKWRLEHTRGLALNNAGMVAWWSRLEGDVYKDSGIWAYQDGVVREVVREGSQVPGWPVGEVFNVLDSPQLNDTGQLLFGAQSGPEVSPRRNTSVWLREPDGMLKMIARRGDMLDVDSGSGVDLRTIERVGIASGESAFNNRGDVLLVVTFTDGNQGLFVVSTVPEPVAASSLILGAAILTAPRRVRRGPL